MFWSGLLTELLSHTDILSTSISGSETCDRAVRCYDEHVKFRGGGHSIAAPESSVCLLQM